MSTACLASRSRYAAEQAHLLASRFLELLAQLPINVDSSPSDVAGIVATGRRHTLSSYDAAYLLLAERLGAALATLDKLLAKAARKAGVHLLINP
jgi:predicted nucleic acid-binding protein